MTQCEKILMYMATNGAITQKEAYFLGCTRLAARISDLKAAGHKINSIKTNVINADGSHSWVSVYSLEEGDTWKRTTSLS